jgi:hypothetical protein
VRKIDERGGPKCGTTVARERSETTPGHRSVGDRTHRDPTRGGAEHRYRASFANELRRPGQLEPPGSGATCHPSRHPSQTHLMRTGKSGRTPVEGLELLASPFSPFARARPKTSELEHSSHQRHAKSVLRHLTWGAPRAGDTAFDQQRNALRMESHREGTDDHERKRDPLRSAALRRRNRPLTCGDAVLGDCGRRSGVAGLC